MKILYLAAGAAVLAMLVGCGHDFEEGDCIQRNNPDPWLRGPVYKILRVGQTGYKLDISYPLNFGMDEWSFKKVECPR